MGLFKPTISNILGRFHKAIADLEALHTDHSETIKFNDDLIEELHKESTTLHLERTKALTISNKIKDLINA